jgi:uncharacterized membrane protein
MKPPQELAEALLRRKFEAMTELERDVVHRTAEGRHVSRDTNREYDERLTFGQRLADRVAAFGGSWSFIMIAGAVLAGWIGLNVLLLVSRGKTIDPYPFILLNLMLSMLAAMQAPVIMMSQNRQETKDRINAAHDYEVNLKAELEIMGLHQKMDTLREKQWAELLELQQKQISLMERLLADRSQA